MGDLLVVVAVPQEAASLSGVDVVLTGLGKVAAAATVAAAIAERRPSRVLNVGSAGALRDGLEGVHRVGTVLQHDFDHLALGALLGEPLPGEIVLDPGSPIVLATGDRFVDADEVRRELAARAHLVDMEGYAVARACALFDVPCDIVKVVSDTASDGAARTWREAMADVARLVAEAVATYR